MPQSVQGVLAALGRVLLCLIFLMSAAGNKIPNFAGVVQYMEAAGVPAPSVLLVGAIAFLLVGSVSVMVGYRARVGAVLLLVFLALASYYFHPFWSVEPARVQGETIQFMKNLSMMGAMLFVIANGAGPMSVDRLLAGRDAAALPRYK